MYVLGLVILYLFCKRSIKNGKLDLTVKQLDSLITWQVIGMIIGARIFAVVFWEPAYYLSHLGDVLLFWKGGLSFHGGLLGIVLASLYWCRRNNKQILPIADVMAIPLALGLMFGRIGNFINGELYGKVTSFAWGVIFPGVEGARHPNQIYEAIYSLIMFITLFYMSKKDRKAGTILAWFMILYAIFRTLTEFIREPTMMIGPLTMGQILNIPLLLFGLWLLKKNK
jgi:phosphatidylglycerol:prolipoprotein diacylglycerol transferase